MIRFLCAYDRLLVIDRVGSAVSGEVRAVNENAEQALRSSHRSLVGSCARGRARWSSYMGM